MSEVDGARDPPGLLTFILKSFIIGNQMVTNERSRQLDLVFGALADATRREIIARLAQGEATVGELAAPFEISRPAVSKHLRVLERAGLIHRTRDGRVRRCELEAGAIREAAAWVERYREFWEDRLDAFATYLETDADSATIERTTTNDD